jgi:rhodanese-related sulfurtransferase
MRFAFTPLALAVALLAGAACDKSASTAAVASSSYTTIDPKRASALMRTGGVDMILDVRTPGEFSAGKIEGATLLPIDSLPGSLDTIADRKETTILVYCAVGARSAAASKFLANNGFTRIVDLQGGIVGWQNAGLPTVR